VEEVSAWVRELHERDKQSGTYAEIAANAARTLIVVACSLLDRQIAAQAKAFKQEGGFTERLYRVRRQARGKP
jgi:four helix bundle suffix protein